MSNEAKVWGKELFSDSGNEFLDGAMEEQLNSLSVVDHFGPKITKVKLSDKVIRSLKYICFNSSTPVNDKLVGLIVEEIDITEQLLANTNVLNTLLGHAEEYMLNIDSGIWNKVIHEEEPRLPSIMQLDAGWYNNQRAGEHNPPHDHRYSCDVVCVIFPHIQIDKDNNKFYNVVGKEKQLGQLNFLHGETDKNGFGTKLITIQPEQGEMYVFPASLTHYTTPIVGDSIRYSIGCNFSITNLVRKQHSKLLKEAY